MACSEGLRQSSEFPSLRALKAEPSPPRGPEGPSTCEEGRPLPKLSCSL